MYMGSGSKSPKTQFQLKFDPLLEAGFRKKVEETHLQQFFEQSLSAWLKGTVDWIDKLHHCDERVLF